METLGVRSLKSAFCKGGLRVCHDVAARLGRPLKNNQTFLPKLSDPAFQRFGRHMKFFREFGDSESRLAPDQVKNGFYSPRYSPRYSLKGFRIRLERGQEPASHFSDLETHLRIGFELLADADEAAAVFFDVPGQVEGLGDQLVAQVRLVMIRLEIRDRETAVQFTGASSDSWGAS